MYIWCDVHFNILFSTWYNIMRLFDLMLSIKHVSNVKCINKKNIQISPWNFQALAKSAVSKLDAFVIGWHMSLFVLKKSNIQMLL